MKFLLITILFLSFFIFNNLKAEGLSETNSINTPPAKISKLPSVIAEESKQDDTSDKSDNMIYQEINKDDPLNDMVDEETKKDEPVKENILDKKTIFKPEPLDKSFLKSYEFLEDLNLSVSDKINLKGDPDNYVILFTPEKLIIIYLYADVAPKTVSDFKDLVRAKFYNNTTFFRLIPNYLVQAGDPTDSGYGGMGKLRKAEINSEVKFKRGSVAMANTGNLASDDSQFFITFNSFPWLDGKNTIFGIVISGINYLESLGGNYDANGYLQSPLVIEKAYVYSDYLEEINAPLPQESKNNVAEIKGISPKGISPKVEAPKGISPKVEAPKVDTTKAPEELPNDLPKNKETKAVDKTQPAKNDLSKLVSSNKNTNKDVKQPTGNAINSNAINPSTSYSTSPNTSK